MENSINKLQNFPIVNCLSLADSVERQKYMIHQFNSFGLKYKIIEGYDGRKIDYANNPIVEGKFFDQMNSGLIAITMSHLKSIKDWYETSDETYGFFCEDDIDLETINYWNFNWDDIVSRLPKDWKAVQLCLIREQNEIINEDIKLNIRYSDNWSAAAYIITKNYAKEIISKYINKDLTYKLEPKYWVPFAENIIFGDVNSSVFTLPLFIENVKTFSHTLFPVFYNEVNIPFKTYSHNFIINWWKNNTNKNQLDILFNDLKLYI